MSYTVGVVVGRFQVDRLHEAHTRLLQHAREENDRLVILVGVPAIQGTFRNPMDFATRAAMLRGFTSDDPQVTILPIHDRESDHVWSKQLDDLLSMVHPDAVRFTLYHARDGFGDHYHGRHQCLNVDGVFPAIDCSGTQIRSDLGAKISRTPEFRHGVIYASQHVWPFVRMAVDMICYKEPTEAKGSHGIALDGSVLVGRKEHETEWRLPGGLVDPTDSSMELAAIRELIEETSIGCETTPEYICSGPVDDWRYGGLENEALFSTCYCAPYSFGLIKAADDLAEVKWMAFADAMEELRPEHRRMFLEFMNKKYPERLA